MHRKWLSLVVYAVLVLAAVMMFKLVPSGFVPGQDKQSLVGFAQLSDAASLDHTDALIPRMSDIAKSVQGVQDSVAFPGLSINGFTNAPNAGVMFFSLKPFNVRTGAGQSDGAIV